MSATATPAPPRLRRRPSGEPPPLPRELNRAAVGWLTMFVFWAALWVWIFLSDRPAIWITERDLELMRPVVDHRVDWLDPVMQRVNEATTNWAVPLVGWVTIAGALAARRIRHALVTLASLSTVAALVTMVGVRINRPRPLGVDRIGDWEGFAQPSRPLALLATAMLAGALTLVPSDRRRWCYRSIGAVLAVAGAAQVYTGVEHPTDAVVGATVGIALPLTIFRLAVPEAAFPIAYGTGPSAHLDVGGARGRAIAVGLRRQLGIEATTVCPVGTESSAGSTPLRIDDTDGERYFAKLYARNHLRSDRSYKLGRALLYGRLEDEQRFTSVRRLVQHEDYMLHVMTRVGLPCPAPVGLVEITPDREYMLVTEFLHDAVEIDAAEITDELADEALAMIATMWHAGLAHRDVKPANVMVQDGHVRLVDVSFAQVRPSPWRQAVDLANMMLVLALGSTAERVYQRALVHFAPDEIAEAFAASRGVTIPSQLRRSLRRDGRDLLAEFRALAPARPPVAIQRWSLRRIGLMVWMLAITFAVVGVLAASLEAVGLR